VSGTRLSIYGLVSGITLTDDQVKQLADLSLEPETFSGHFVVLVGTRLVVANRVKMRTY
jgi:hypothetical protein